MTAKIVSGNSGKKRNGAAEAAVTRDIVSRSSSVNSFDGSSWYAEK
jgi:hypothetical protein